nr:hypothetical protein [Tanacetum cinerariifolium]
YSNPENPNELFQKLLEDLKELAKYKESLENSSKEIAISSSNQEKEEPPQDFNIRQLIREECSVKVCEEQKQSMKDTMLELVKICQEKELLCIHDNVDGLIESALNSKLLLINSNSQRLDKKEQEVKNIAEKPGERGNCIQSLHNFKVVHKNSISLNNTSQISSIHAVTTIISTKEPEHSLSMGYEHLSITPETESDEVTESNAENLLPIPRKCEVTLEDENKCDVPISENSPICDDHSNIFSDYKEDDDISVYDDDFEDIEFETFCDYTEETRSGNTNHADNSFPEYDSFCFEIEPDQERLVNLVKSDISDNSSNDPLLEEADLFHASDNLIPPGIENVANDSEGDENPSIPRPPLEPPDAETDAGEEIPVMMNDKDKFDKDYYFFMFAKDLPPVIEVFLCWIFVPVSKIFTSFDLKLVWRSPYPLICIA